MLELIAVAERLEAGIFSSLVRWELLLQFSSTTALVIDSYFHEVVIKLLGLCCMATTNENENGESSYTNHPHD